MSDCDYIGLWVENSHTVFISKNVVANSKTMLRKIIISVWMQQYAIETWFPNFEWLYHYNGFQIWYMKSIIFHASLFINLGFYNFYDIDLQSCFFQSCTNKTIQPNLIRFHFPGRSMSMLKTHYHNILTNASCLYWLSVSVDITFAFD